MRQMEKIKFNLFLKLGERKQIVWKILISFFTDNHGRKFMVDRRKVRFDF